MNNTSPFPSREKFPVITETDGKMYAQVPFSWVQWFSALRESNQSMQTEIANLKTRLDTGGL